MSEDEVTETQSKFPFASPAWVDMARNVLEELVSQYGEIGKKFSVCEAFADAPEEFADAEGYASWHFYVNETKVRVGVGRIDDADVQIQASWALSLPGARLVYTAEVLAEWERNPPQRPDDPHEHVEGDMSALPDYLLELHNRMAVITE